MNFDFAMRVNEYLVKFEFDNAAALCESNLSNLPVSDFHMITGKSFLNQKDALVDWIEEFYRTISKAYEIKALYFEMIEFDINTSEWNITGFAFEEDGGSNDFEWLCDFKSEDITSDEFILQGFRSIQLAFEKTEIDSEDLQESRDWCEQAIIVRFMELMRNVHLIANERKLLWAKIPLYFTEHDYDFVVRSIN